MASFRIFCVIFLTCLKPPYFLYNSSASLRSFLSLNIASPSMSISLRPCSCSGSSLHIRSCITFDAFIKPTYAFSGRMSECSSANVRSLSVKSFGERVRHWSRSVGDIMIRSDYISIKDNWGGNFNHFSTFLPDALGDCMTHQKPSGQGHRRVEYTHHMVFPVPYGACVRGS